MTRRWCVAPAVLLATTLVLGPLAAPARAVVVAPGFPGWLSPGFLGHIWSFLQEFRAARGLDLGASQSGQAASGAMIDPDGVQFRQPGQAASGAMIDPNGRCSRMADQADDAGMLDPNG